MHFNCLSFDGKKIDSCLYENPIVHFQRDGTQANTLQINHRNMTKNHKIEANKFHFDNFRNFKETRLVFFLQSFDALAEQRQNFGS